MEHESYAIQTSDGGETVIENATITGYDHLSRDSTGGKTRLVNVKTDVPDAQPHSSPEKPAS